jgi:hypothetical protein
MAQLDNRSDKELKEALESGELGPRKSAFAKEILRRRAEAKGGGQFFLITGVLAAITVALAAIKRLWRR